jgi:hypothetical protein
MSYLFIKNLFRREKFVLFSKKIKKLEKPQKNIFSGFFEVGFLGGFFWVGLLLPTLDQGQDPARLLHARH